jgi:hypothetical protein
MLGVALTISAVVAGARGASGAAGAVTPARSVHVVRPGETLWGIASRLAGAGGDPRPVVDRIAAINHLGMAPLQVGARLVLPPS